MVKGTPEGLAEVSGVFPGAIVSGWASFVGGKGCLLFSGEERRSPHAHAYTFDHYTNLLNPSGRVSVVLA